MYQMDVKSEKRVELIDITNRVQRIVSKKNLSSGLCCLYVPHTTAGLTVNENADPSVVEDIVAGLGRLLDSMPYKHSEGNSPGHIKSSLIGCSTNVLIENGKLVLGTWQGIFFCEFDGPRNRRLYINLLPAD